MARAAQDIGVALDDFSEAMAAGATEERDFSKRTALSCVRNLTASSPRGHRRSAQGSRFGSPTVRQAVSALKGDLAPQLESAQALKHLAASIKPLLLIIDDDDFQHRLLRQLFAGEAFDMAFATSSVEALSVMRQRRPDLILMDVDLPDLDGVETTRKFKTMKQYARIPIVMITGHGAKDVGHSQQERWGFRFCGEAVL